MPPSNLRSAVEALLFSSDQPLTLALLIDALESPSEDVTAALQSLGEEYAAREAGVLLREMAGGWVFMTAPEQNEWVTRMLRGKRKMRLSRAALETMAIIAYKQPVTKSEVEAIRGVDASGVLATLLERNLVTIKGRSTVVGRPLLYGTTDEFLNYFGLRDLSELPRPEELRALVAAREPEQMEMMELDPASGMPLALPEGQAGAEGAAGAEAAADTGSTEAVAAEGEPDATALLSDEPVAAAAPATEEEEDERFSIADADAAIAAANAARGEAVLAMASDMDDAPADFAASDDDADEDDEDEYDDDEFEGDDDGEFDDSYDDDDDDEDEDDEDEDADEDDDRPRATLSETEGA
ncbi:MAG: SMC-Scp complex subunit ScpB [Candidatus Eisenbacteria bacterium]